ncbi:Coactosin [Entamoeba marina]
MSGFDLSDPEIAQAVQEVIDDKVEDVEYCILGCQTQPNKVFLETKGKGGLDEVKAALRDDALQFAYYRTISGDEESRRVKFVFISWAGDNIRKPKLRAVMSILKGDVKSIINNFHVELHATSQEDLDAEEIATKIKKAGGADYSFNTSSS